MNTYETRQSIFAQINKRVVIRISQHDVELLDGLFSIFIGNFPRDELPHRAILNRAFRLWRSRIEQRCYTPKAIHKISLDLSEAEVLRYVLLSQFEPYNDLVQLAKDTIIYKINAAAQEC